jgi:hypothetical protein
MQQQQAAMDAIRPELIVSGFLWKGSQPFAIVPYHHPLNPFSTGEIEPPPPEFTFKDGLGATCTGARIWTSTPEAPTT